MSNDGENILKLFKQIRQIFEQVSLLLRTVDEQMIKADWKSMGNYALSDLSYSILEPASWIPIMVYRYYKHKESPNRLAYVSVLLDNHWDRKYTIKEPLLTAGFLDFEKDEVFWENWYARFFGYLSEIHDLRADGQPFQFENTKLPSDIQGKFRNGKVFAIPLISITNAKDVESKVTVKLLNLLRNGNSQSLNEGL
jgi:hypothetical protein